MELQRPRNSNKSNVEIEEKPIVIKKNTRFIPEAELNEVKQGTVTYESELLKYAFFCSDFFDFSNLFARNHQEIVNLRLYPVRTLVVDEEARKTYQVENYSPIEPIKTFNPSFDASPVV